VPLSIGSAALAPTATTSAALQLNLNSGAGVPSFTTFDATNPLSYTATTTTNVYDASGAPVNVHTFYVNNNAAGISPSTVSVYAFVGDPVTLTGSVPLGTLNFTGNTLTSSTASATGSVPVTANGSMGVFTGVNVGAKRVSLDMSNTVQWNSPFAATATQNGSAPGQLLSYQIAPSGIITSTYSNGQTANVGQVALASFQNVNGLALNANNEFLATTASGPVSINAAGAGGLGTIQGSATEDSNVNLTNEMVNLIAAQRLYQAAAEVIKIQGQNMTTAVQLAG
jgi:flagellar hook protein FlgE